VAMTIPIPIAGITREREQPSRTYRIDFERGRIFSAGSCDGLEAVNQFIKKALLTPRFRCLIYDNQYGSEIKQTIQSGDVSGEYIKAETPRLVKDALLADSRILDIYNFSYSFDGDEAYIRFEADTVFGKTAVDTDFNNYNTTVTVINGGEDSGISDFDAFLQECYDILVSKKYYPRSASAEDILTALRNIEVNPYIIVPPVKENFGIINAAAPTDMSVTVFKLTDKVIVYAEDVGFAETESFSLFGTEVPADMSISVLNFTENIPFFYPVSFSKISNSQVNLTYSNPIYSDGAVNIAAFGLTALGVNIAVNSIQILPDGVTLRINCGNIVTNIGISLTYTGSTGNLYTQFYEKSVPDFSVFI